MSTAVLMKALIAASTAFLSVANSAEPDAAEEAKPKGKAASAGKKAKAPAEDLDTSLDDDGLGEVLDTSLDDDGLGGLDDDDGLGEEKPKPKPKKEEPKAKSGAPDLVAVRKKLLELRDALGGDNGPSRALIAKAIGDPAKAQTAASIAPEKYALVIAAAQKKIDAAK